MICSVQCVSHCLDCCSQFLRASTGLHFHANVNAQPSHPQLHSRSRHAYSRMCRRHGLLCVDVTCLAPIRRYRRDSLVQLSSSRLSTFLCALAPTVTTATAAHTANDVPYIPQPSPQVVEPAHGVAPREEEEEAEMVRHAPTPLHSCGSAKPLLAT